MSDERPVLNKRSTTGVVGGDGKPGSGVRNDNGVSTEQEIARRTKFDQTAGDETAELFNGFEDVVVNLLNNSTLAEDYYRKNVFPKIKEQLIQSKIKEQLTQSLDLTGQSAELDELNTDSGFKKAFGHWFNQNFDYIKSYYNDLSSFHKAAILQNLLLLEYKDRYFQKLNPEEDNDNSCSEEVALARVKRMQQIFDLFSDEKVRELYLLKRAELGVVRRRLRLSEMLGGIEALIKEIASLSEQITGVNVMVRSGVERVVGEDDKLVTKSLNPGLIATYDFDNQQRRMVLEQKQKELSVIMSLQPDQCVNGNTDVLAFSAYKRLLDYNKQYRDSNYILLPSQEALVGAAVKYINEASAKGGTPKMILFVSPPGSGKSTIPKELAKILTPGLDIQMIACNPDSDANAVLNEGKDALFLGATNPDEAVYKKFEDTLVKAWTGFSTSFDKKGNPDQFLARVVCLDEFLLVASDPRFVAAIKRLMQQSDGGLLAGKPVLPGRVLIATGNPGEQYLGKGGLAEALKREALIFHVKYPPQNELHAFMLATLMDHGTIKATKEELSVGYTQEDLVEEGRYQLEDGSTVIGTEERIADTFNDDKTHKKYLQHGYVYRLAAAIHAIHDTYVFKDGDNEYISNTKGSQPIRGVLEDGNFVIKNETTGQVPILSQTITLKEIGDWMNAYNVSGVPNGKTLTAFLQGKLEDLIEHAMDIDKPVLKAIFEHYGVLGKEIDNNIFKKYKDSKTSPLISAFEIGYCLASVPRPLKVIPPVPVEPVVVAENPSPIPESVIVEQLERRKLTLLNGTTIILDESNSVIVGQDGKPVDLVIGKNLKIFINGNNILARYIGTKYNANNIDEDGKSNITKETNFIVELVDEESGEGNKIYEDLDENQMEVAEFKYKVHELQKEMQTIDVLVGEFWKAECDNNLENNPDKLVSPFPIAVSA